MLVYNRTKEIAEQHAAEFGTTVMTSLEDLSSVDVCVLCLPTSVIVKDICTKIGAILKSGALVIDATSGDPTLSIQIAKDLSQYGIDYVDCPVSGGPSGAAQGSLTSMIGGQKNPSQRALEFVSSTFSKEGKVVVVGPIGSAHSVKAINNCLNATHLIVACEGLLALKASGISPATALSVINNSSGRSLQTEKRIPETVLTRNFNYGFSITLMAKDVRIANAILDNNYPTCSKIMRETLSLYEKAVIKQGKQADYTEVVKLLEDLCSGNKLE